MRNGRYVIPVRDDARRGGARHHPRPVAERRHGVRRARGDDPAQQRADARLPRGAGRGAAPARGADRRRAAHRCPPSASSSRGSAPSTSSSRAPRSPSGSTPPSPRWPSAATSTSARPGIPCWSPSAGAPRPGAGEVVPIDLRVPADRPGLVLSGPNAGGKTVALETAGLLVLMAQAGCHIPAAPGSRVPLTEQVLAVIGDEQSLAQDLSTFSSFVRQVREILTVAGPASLVLLDELGAGTDPDGGRGARRRAPRGAPRPRRAHRRHDAPRAAQGLRPGGAAPRRTRPSRSTPSGSSRRSGSSTGIPARATRSRSPSGSAFPPEVIARARCTSARRAAGSRPSSPRWRRARATPRRARRRRPAARPRRRPRWPAPGSRPSARGPTRGSSGAPPRQQAQALLANARRQVGQELDRLKVDEAGRRRAAQEAYRRLRVAEAIAPARAPAASRRSRGAPRRGPAPRARAPGPRRRRGRRPGHRAGRAASP